jgi:hypothetical protein
VFDPKVLEQGIPDEAYKPLLGDDKPTCTSLKRENASFRKAGQKGILKGTLNVQVNPPINRSQRSGPSAMAFQDIHVSLPRARQPACVWNCSTG